ncbi:MAG: YbaK/EbsC family protein [Alphaproteobacteria bacterium]|nr:YbaK/EbsC family protein [Alphaproteobacteria bacterium]
MASDSGGSAARVRAALAAAGHPDTIVAVAETARTATGAARAVGCTVAQIAKSIVFRAADGRSVLVIASGVNRVDPARVASVLGIAIGRADAEWVRSATGFAIGGVAPVGHLTPPRVLLDEDLLLLDPVWAAAGAPQLVFRTTAEALCRMSGARVAAVRA